MHRAAAASASSSCSMQQATSTPAASMGVQQRLAPQRSSMISRAVVAPLAASRLPAAPSSHMQQQQPYPAQLVQQQQHAAAHSSNRRKVVPAAAAAATASVDLDELIGPSKLEADVFEIITYALKLAWTSETYYVHSWMVLLGLLKQEGSIACEVLRELGLEDIYGAWNEVLWALNVADGLTPRAFTPYMQWGERASLIVQGAVRYGAWAGRDKVTTEDLLMAFAASDVLTSLFPDVDLAFDRVKRAVEKKTGVTYNMPGYEPGSVLSSQDNFL